MALSDLELIQLVERAEQGRQGERGPEGVGIRSIESPTPGLWVITLTDGRKKEFTYPLPKDGEMGPAGPVGPQGEPGVSGARGPAGPAGRDGRDGVDGGAGVSLDSVLVNSQGELLVGLTDGQVINAGRVVGPAGATGERGLTGLRGEAGRDGNSILSGYKAPSDDEGQDGDFYIDLSSPNYDFYGPKRSGGWGGRTTFLKQPPAQQNTPARSFPPVGGGGAGGGGGIQPPFDINMPVSTEVEIGRARGDAVFVEYKVAEIADATRWSAGSFNTAATALLDDAEFSIGAELFGTGGDLDLAWRVQRLGDFLIIYATAPVDSQIKGRIRAITE